jgi:hypothetical protein
METLNGAKFHALPIGLRSSLNGWLTGYVGAAHPDLGRDGYICPFVQPSLQARSLIAVGRRWRPGDDVHSATKIIADSVELFETIPWNARQSNLHALVVVITDMPRTDWWLVDEAHRLAKDSVVDRDLMVGQFHPECDAPAVYNEGFPVNRSPWPLYAIRQMAFHDILFLHDNPVWFDRYRRRYGHRYRPGAKIDSHFRDLYRSAERAAEGLAGCSREPDGR